MTPSASDIDVQQFLGQYSRSRQRLFLYVKMFVPNPDDVEDILQETSVILWQKYGEYKPGTSFYAWSKAIARNKVLQHREKFARRQRILDSEAFEVVMEKTDAMENVLQDRRAALRNCIEKLSETDQKLISQRYAPGGSGQSLAEELGRPRNSVYKSITRIRRSLMNCIRISVDAASPEPSGA